MILLALLLTSTEPTPAGPPPPPAAEKFKCKSRPVIGSLAQTVKECHTVAEWEALRRSTQADTRRMMNSAVSAQH